MYIVAIAWLYVTILMALAETTVTRGVVTFALYGALPLSIVLYLMGTPQRRRNRRAREAAEAAEAADQGAQPVRAANEAPADPLADPLADGSADGSAGATTGRAPR